MEGPESPIDAPASDEARAALLLLPGSPLPVRDASRILAPALGMPDPDVAARIRYGGGILATGLARADADPLAAALARIGVRVAILAGSPLDPPRPIRAVGMSFEEAGLALRRLNGPPIDVPWTDVRGISCSALLLSGDRPMLGGDPSLVRARGRVDTLIQRLED
ncbi:MAG: hypothetical protein JXP34_00225, partial [Planctomycetes bacterium]|nr:hypothetical protein [Planctomycetota bacterium]